MSQNFTCPITPRFVSVSYQCPFFPFDPVNVPAEPCPAIVTSPVNVEIIVGEDGTFTVVASGDGVIYRWQVSDDGGTIWQFISDGAEYSGTDEATLTLLNAALGLDGNKYRCMCSRGDCPDVVSVSATVTMVVCPQIVDSPDSVEVLAGDPTDFVVVASGTAVLYQWEVSTNGGVDWAPVADGAEYSGTDTDTLTVLDPTLAMSGYQYRCVCSHAGCPDVTSAAAEMLVADPAIASFDFTSLESSATLIGISEYTSPSTPPKKYRTQTITGSAMWCQGTTDCPGGSSGQRSFQRLFFGTYAYPVGGGAAVNTQIERSYESPSPTATCGAGLVYQADNVQAEAWSPTGAWWGMGGGIMTVTLATSQSSSPDGLCGTNGDGILLTGGPAQKTLTDEDTENDAIARVGAPTPGTSDQSYRETRGAGDFTFSWRDSIFHGDCTGLLVGNNYQITLDIDTEDYGGGGSVVTQLVHVFMASAGSETIDVPIPCASGKQVTASNPSIVAL